ncbi:MAG: NAD(P)-dependent oxidoreductase [Treponemataceae bacterium]|nr:NAD(P)-dependent oxidoreductase [Treponemataceae bacterium]
MENEKTVVAVTGSDGAMGGEVVSHLLDSDKNFELRLFVYNKTKKCRKFFKSLLKRGKNRITLIRGDLANYEQVANLVEGADYVVHCGAVIPPKADHNPENTRNTNFIGTKNIVDAIKNSGRADKIKLVHISTVAVYGNRDYHHPWARMGDPVISSAFDYYSAYKIKGERYVLESGLPHWVVLRQTAVYHKYFLSNNMNDGLMFHTSWNAPFEWITDRDSGLCIQHLVERDVDGKLNGFWHNDYNIGGGAPCRETGYEVFNEGFGLFGASAEDFFEPNWNIPRNFHGVWYTDSHILDKWLDYRRESSADYWKRMGKELWYYKLGAIVPKKWIRKLAIERLLKNSNAPMYWVRSGNKGRIDAFFGGEEAYNNLPKNWSEFPVNAKGRSWNGELDYAELKDESKADKYALDHGYDETKPDSEIDIDDLKKAAAFRGGEVLSEDMKKGDLFQKITWKCHNGHRFDSTPFTILKAGFWCPECCEAPKWSFDKVAAKIPFYSQVWYDTHRTDEENNEYPYDEHADDNMIVPVEKL